MLWYTAKKLVFVAFQYYTNYTIPYSASGCPIAAKNKGKSGYEGISSLSKYGSSSSTFGPFDQSNDHMMGVDDKDKNRMDTSDGLDEKVRIRFSCITKYNTAYPSEYQFLFNIKTWHTFY